MFKFLDGLGGVFFIYEYGLSLKMEELNFLQRYTP